ncbi:MAG: exodeoxyribonuclease VII small subunit, partial [Proteobacteria bacterium]|nr:exodeoxyribonuclease VII small subunit [Pseudomonadota bacterium]
MSESAKNEKIPGDIVKLSFEEALAALEEIVSRLEGGAVSLEESIDIYTRGTHLRRHCEEKLRLAQERIDKIVPGPDGGI